MTFKHSRSALALAIAASLSACGGGGGGGNVRPNTPPPVVGPTTCQDTTATNYGGPLPCTYPAPTYTGSADNAIVGTGADKAHAEGYTGAGVKVGVLDDAQITPYAATDSKTKFYKDYTGQGADPSTDPLRGHGNAISAIIAGTPSGTFKGGVAPGADLYRARICYDNFCSYTQAGQAVNELSGMGVRLFNFSIGGWQGSDSANATAAKNLGNNMAGVLAVNGLMVTPTGNDSSTNAGSSAVVPYYQAQYINNWIATTAVALDSQGKPAGLAQYANQCGLAMNWCLAAPGLIEIPAIPGTSYTWAIQGTSAATAATTGVAALVWGAYPWMTGPNVQQTLLTTATDLGAAGVDPVYGWGMINAAKAVHGPGQFVTDFSADVTGGNYTFSNNISGNGGLIKKGAGQLNLSGVNTYKGATSVQAGTLGLSGSITSDVTVGSGATFASYGGKINGSYTAQAGANTAIQVGKGMNVSGAANLAGSVTLLPEPQGYTVAGTETLLTAGSVNGTFGSVQYGSGFFYDATLSYTSTQVNAALTRRSAAHSAATAGASAMVVDGGRQADALISYTDSLVTSGNTAGHEDLINATAALMGAPTQAVAEASLASLTGSIHGTARSLSVKQAINDSDTLADRVASLNHFEDSGAWVTANALDGKLGAKDYASADYRSNGIMVGVDSKLSDDWTVGAAASVARQSANVDDAGGHFTGNRNGLAVYGRKDFGGAYVSGTVGYERADSDVERSVITGTTATAVTSDRSDSTVHARVEAGWKLGDKGGENPYVAIGAVRQTQDAFAESGSALGLAAGKDTHTVTYADLGARFTRDFGKLTVGADGQLRFLLSGDKPNYEASFVGAPGVVFDVNGLPLSTNSLRAGVFLAYAPSSNLSWIARIGGEQAGSESHNLFGTVGVRWSF